MILEILSRIKNLRILFQRSKTKEASRQEVSTELVTIYPIFICPSQLPGINQVHSCGQFISGAD